MATTWINQFVILGALQGILLAFVIVQKKETNKTAARLLTTLLLLTSLVLTGRLFFETSALQRFWLVYTFTDIIIFLFGPVIYLFTHALLKNKLPSSPDYRWHLLPAGIHLILFAPLIALSSSGTISVLNQDQLFFLFSALEFFSIISLGIYSIKSLRLFQAYEAQYYHSFSFPILSSFLKTFLYFFMALSVVWLLSFALRESGVLSSTTAWGYYGFWTLAALSTYLLSYNVLLSPEVLHKDVLLPSSLPVEKEQTTPLSPVAINTQAKDQLIQLLQKSKLYQDPKLSLEKLAQAMQLSRHEVSKIINQGFDKTFFDLINSYRIQAFIDCYQPGQQQTFLEVAYAVGFNSKSAFNRAFRKTYGTSPSDYFKNQLPQNDTRLTI